MEHTEFLFIGGSREGIHTAPAPQMTVTFVDGDFVPLAADGSINAPLNATVETYMLERVATDKGETLLAYFLIGMEAGESKERLEKWSKKV